MILIQKNLHFNRLELIFGLSRSDDDDDNDDDDDDNNDDDDDDDVDDDDDDDDDVDDDDDDVDVESGAFRRFQRFIPIFSEATKWTQKNLKRFEAEAGIIEEN